MPFIARLFVKTGIVYLVLTFLAGGVLLTLEALGYRTPFIIDVEHGHMGFEGWLVNVVIGVALWLLPLNKKRFPNEQGRYPSSAAMSSYLMFNIGLPLRIVVEPLAATGSTAATSALLVLSAILQVAAIAVVAWIVWNRVYPPPLRPNV